MGGYQGEIRDEQKVMDIVHQIHSIVKEKKKEIYIKRWLIIYMYVVH